MKLNLREKIILPFIIVVILMASYIYFVPYKNAIKHERNNVDIQIISNVRSLTIPLTSALLENDLSNIYETIDNTLDKNPDWYSLQLYNADGIMIYPLEAAPAIPDDISQDAPYVEKIIYQANYMGKLVLYADVQAYLEQRMLMARNLIVFNLIILVTFIILLSIALDYFIRKPISDLAKVAGHLANGDFNAIIPKSSNDEVGKLIDAFKLMRNSINNSNLELENQKYALDMHCMVYVADEDEHVVYANDRFCVTGAYNKVDVISRNMFSFIDESSNPNIRNNILSEINSGRVWNGELNNIKKNGSLYYTEATIVPFINERGKPYKYIVIQTDISMKVYSELLANKASDRINYLLKYSSTIIYSRSLLHGLEINFISENVNKILGYEQYHVLQNADFYNENIHPDDINKFINHWKHISGTELHNIEYRIKNKEGNYVWFVDSHRLIYDEAGKPIDIVGSLSDISERVKVKNEIECRIKQQATVSSLGQFALQSGEIDELFNKTVRNITQLLDLDLCMVLEFDKDNNVFTIHTFNGCDGLISPTLIIPADLTTHAGQTLASNSEVLVEDMDSDTRFEHPNFLTDLGLSSGLTIPITGRKHLYGVLCVYTKEHRLFTYDDVQFIRSTANVLGLSVERTIFENELVEYQEHLIDMVDDQTQDLIVARDAALVAERSMTTFLSNMSHELRTPLHGILSFARFGIKKYETASKEKLYDYFSEIYDSGQTLLNLVSTLLDLSKLKAGKMVYEYHENNIINLAASIIKEYSALCMEKSISITFNYNQDIIMCEADGEKIRQVVRNLISNSIKFSEAGSMVEMTAEQTDQHVIVSVIDYGLGIPEDEVESIFKPFTQSSLTKTSAGGTGLGLSICKEIIESGHKGWIKAESKKGEGARFTFSLPLKVFNSEPLRQISRV